MKRQCMLIVLIVALAAGGASGAIVVDRDNAVFDALGSDPHSGFTASVAFSGYTPFFQMEAFIVSESGQGPFLPPGITVDGIDGSVINPSYALVTVAGGSGSGNLTLHLAGSPIGTIQIDLLSYDASGNLLASIVSVTGRLTLSGGSFERFRPGLLEDSYDRSPIPEPATLAIWSVLSGLGLIATRRWKPVA